MVNKFDVLGDARSSFFFLAAVQLVLYSLHPGFLYTKTPLHWLIARASTARASIVDKEPSWSVSK